MKKTISKSKYLTTRRFLTAFGVFLVSTFYLLGGTSVFAARFFSDEATPIGVGGEAKIDIYVDSENETINALEGKVRVPKNIDGVDTLYGSSLVPLWLEKPQIKNGEIIFSGIIPGGVSVSRGYIFSVIVKAKSSGENELLGSGGVVYLHDGEGTRRPAKMAFSKITVSESEATGEFEITDVLPPEEFNASIATSSDIFNGKYFVVFETQDKESGVARYEIQERKNKKPASDAWKDAVSPYELFDQTLSSYIFIRATDKKGNERVVKISPSNAQISYTDILLYGILAIFIALVFRPIKRFLKRN